MLLSPRLSPLQIMTCLSGHLQGFRSPAMPSVRSVTFSTTRSLSLALHSRGRTAQASVVQMQSCSYHGYHALSHDSSPGHSTLALYTTGLVALLTAQQRRVAQGSGGHLRFHCGSDKDSRASSHVYCHSSPTPCPSLATHFVFCPTACVSCMSASVDRFVHIHHCCSSTRIPKRSTKVPVSNTNQLRHLQKGHLRHQSWRGVWLAILSADFSLGRMLKISPSNFTLLVAVGSCLAHSHDVHRTPQRDRHWRGLP